MYRKTRNPPYALVLAAVLAGAVSLAPPARAQRTSLESLDRKLSDIQRALDETRAIIEQGPFPISSCGVIKQPGAYQVVQNLVAKGDCIVIDANHVSVDLGGFRLLGDGTGDGISFIGGTVESRRRDLRVSHGTVEGFVDGVNLGVDRITNTGSIGASVVGVRALDNAADGIRVGVDGTVADCLAAGNKLTGIGGLVSASFTNNVADGNRIGLQAFAKSVVRGNIARGNTIAGFSLASGGIVSGNVASDNGEQGFSIGCPSNVFDNSSTDNGENLSSFGPDCRLSGNVAP